MINQLIVLADRLDELELRKECDTIDAILQKLAKEEEQISDFDEDLPTVVDPLAKLPMAQLPTKEQVVMETKSPVTPDEEYALQTTKDDKLIRDAFWALRQLSRASLPLHTRKMVIDLIRKLSSDFAYLEQL